MRNWLIVDWFLRCAWLQLLLSARRTVLCPQDGDEDQVATTLATFTSKQGDTFTGR